MKISIISVADSHGYGKQHLWFLPYMITEEMLNFRQRLVKRKLYSFLPIQLYKTSISIYGPLGGGGGRSVDSRVKKPCWGMSKLAWQCQVHPLECGKGRVSDFSFKGHDLDVAPVPLVNRQSHDHLQYKAGWEMQSSGQPLMLLLRNWKEFCQ